MTWTTKIMHKEAETSNLKLWNNRVELPSGKDITYGYVEATNGVMIVPTKVVNNEINFIFVEQYRYPINRVQLEFPGGGAGKGESSVDAAHRELLEETGYKSSNMKFMYFVNPLPALSDLKTMVYAAVVEGEPGELKLQGPELESGIKVVELPSAEVFRLIRENEITDGQTLAALSAVILQSPLAMNYTRSLIK